MAPEQQAPSPYSEWVERLLTKRSNAVIPPTIAPRHDEYVAVCSVLAQFPLQGLRSASGPIDSEDLKAALGPDLIRIPSGSGEELFTLSESARRQGLRSFAARSDLIAARQLNTLQPVLVMQQVLDEYLRGDFSSASSTDPEHLTAALHVSAWIEEAKPEGLADLTMPSQRTIQRKLALQHVLEPMERLTQSFVGRDAELASLRAFVGVVDPKSTAENIGRRAASIVSREAQGPRYVQGIGGIGKSTLISRFILEHASSTVPFPWVYLDFDSPRLSVSDLGSIVDEAANQLEAQYVGSNWTDARSAAADLAMRVESSLYDSSNPQWSLTVRDLDAISDIHSSGIDAVAAQFANSLTQALQSTTIERIAQTASFLPFLIVLDTLEEVQKRGMERGAVLWRFLAALQNEYPRLRIVMAGRADLDPDFRINRRRPDVMALEAFDEDLAVAFLRVSGITSEPLARALFKQVGGSPLSLRLAAEVARAEATEEGGIQDLDTRSFFLFSASEAAVQGQLYTRILNRIQDPDVRALANPGLVVRRVTSEIIADVLAVPCGLGQIDEERAQELFAGLKKQAGLVTVTKDGVLRHQVDIRRVMLKLLERDRPEQVHQIHAAAFTFYSDRDTVIDRAERVYHALMLGQDESSIRTMWREGIADSLLASMDELPAAAQLTLSLLTGHSPGTALRQAADQEQWERIVEQKARDAVQFGELDAAKKLLAERKDRVPGSGLYAVDALLQLRARSYSAAAASISAGIGSAREAQRLDRLVELYRLRGQLLAAQNKTAEANRALVEAGAIAGRIRSPILQLQILSERARLDDEIAIPELNDVLIQTSDADFASARLQLRGLFERCGPQSDVLLTKGLGAFIVQCRDAMTAASGISQYLQGLRPDDQVNERLVDLLGRNPKDGELRRHVASVLEFALDPRHSQRAR